MPSSPRSPVSKIETNRPCRRRPPARAPKQQPAARLGRAHESPPARDAHDVDDEQHAGRPLDDARQRDHQHEHGQDGHDRETVEHALDDEGGGDEPDAWTPVTRPDSRSFRAST